MPDKCLSVLECHSRLAIGVLEIPVRNTTRITLALSDQFLDQPRTLREYTRLCIVSWNGNVDTERRALLLPSANYLSFRACTYDRIHPCCIYHNEVAA